MPYVAKLHELAAAVARRLPPGWDYAEDPMRPGTIDGPDGMILVLSPSSFAGREVRGVLPVEISASLLPDRLRSRCRIRVASAHDADILASQIEHRLLPAYLPLFRELATRGAEPLDPYVGLSPLPALQLEPLAADCVRVTVVVPRDRVPGLRSSLAALTS